MGGVVLAWVLTFVVMGGNISLGGDDSKPVAHTTLTPTTTYPTPTPLGPSKSATTGNANAAGSDDETPGEDATSAEKAATTAPLAGRLLLARPKPRRSPPPVAEFRMASFNVLGSSHTRRGTKRPQKASGSARMARATQYVLDHDLDLVGFQEFQGDQRSVFLRNTGGAYQIFPGNGLDGENSIAWRTDTWDLVKADTVAIPYFGGHPRNMPVLTLRHKASGIAIIATNFHNPADTREYGRQGRWRAAAKAREAELFGQLRQSGLPIFVTGDMNETNSWFCAVAGPGDLRAAAGGEGGRNGCSVAGGYRVDWIAGSYDVQFSNYLEDKSGYVHWMTDHPVMSASVRIEGADFPKALGRPAA
ncbi:MAG: endonuclease/exonuclease/phosphatase family protein [Nocardioidaceae bacterium]|nr:endonuclease/exonuclease/phosphatase family protein [Nocardioidaceae bacterium]